MIRNVHEVMSLAEQVSRDDAAHVLHHFDEGGWEPGRFTAHLLTAISIADPDNWTRLERGFPGECAAMKIALSVPDGMKILKEIVEGNLERFRLSVEIEKTFADIEEKDAERKRQAWRTRYGTEPPADEDF